MSEESSKKVSVAKEEVLNPGDENEERGNWSNQLDFLLSCIGFAVGLGNVWRFPYKCYTNGGGAFLIPYTICLALAGLPLFFMELAFGQFSSLGPITIWKICPMFKGLGYAMVMISALVCIYYNLVIAYTIFYMFSSFTSTLPWASCDNWWNTPACMTMDQAAALKGNGTNMTEVAACNETLNITTDCLWGNETLKRISPSEEYWSNYVLQISSGLHEMGGVRWQLALVLLVSWILIFACLFKGVKSSGKVVYFTALFPYAVLIALLVRGATLPGAYKGILFYITPRLERLADASVWADAALQIFYSLGPAWGGLITMASYNKFHNNCYRDAIIVAIVNCGTSVFAGFVIFSVIGFMSESLGVDPGEVVASGPGLAFVAYPEGIAQMPLSPLWAVLFFIMLLTLGIDSQMVMMETVISAIIDEVGGKLRSRKTLFTAFLCLLGFLLGLPIVTNGGMYLFNLMDTYTAGISLMLTGLIECLVINWIYGYDNFADDIYTMLGFRPNIYWKVCWKVVSPLVIAGIIVFSFIQYSPIKYGNYEYPWWGDMLGWLMTAASLVFIPGLALFEFCKQAGFMSTMKTVLSQTDDYGPAVGKFREEWETVKHGKGLEMEVNMNDKLEDDEEKGMNNFGFSKENNYNGGIPEYSNDAYVPSNPDGVNSINVGSTGF